MRNLARLAITALFGFAVSLLIVLLLFAVKAVAHYDFYNVFARYIVPVGAVACGIVVGAGFIAGAHASGYRPSRALILLAILAALTVHFGTRLLDYLTLTAYGRPVRTFVSFPRYLNLTAMAWRTDFGGCQSSASDANEAGYLIETFQVSGFTIAALILCSALGQSSYCRDCSGYLKVDKTAVRCSADRATGYHQAERVADLVRAGGVEAALLEFAGYGDDSPPDSAIYRATLNASSCPKCGKRLVSFRVSEKEGEIWMPQDTFRADGVSLGPSRASH